MDDDDVAIYNLYQKYFTYNDTSQDGFKLLLRTKSIKQVDGKLKYIRTNEKFGWMNNVYLKKGEPYAKILELEW